MRFPIRTMATATTIAALSLVSGSSLGFPQTPSGLPQSAPPPTDYVPKPLTGIEIADKRGTFVAKDLRFRDQEGREVDFGRYFEGGKPVVLVFAYYECPMLCTVVLNGLKDGLKDLAWTAGKEFRVVTVSFDERDDAEAAKRKRKAYVDAYGRVIDAGSATAASGWDFLVGQPASVAALTSTVGFSYRWDEKTEQFAHPAGAFVFTPEGRLSQVLHGIRFTERDLRLALTEASQGKLGSAWDRVMLLCYHYDPNEHSYVLAGKRVMRAGGALTALVLLGFLARLWRKELKKDDSLPTNPAALAPSPADTSPAHTDIASEGSSRKVPEATS